METTNRNKQHDNNDNNNNNMTVICLFSCSSEQPKMRQKAGPLNAKPKSMLQDAVMALFLSEGHEENHDPFPGQNNPSQAVGMLHTP
jgi:spore germination protein GerM